MSIAKDSVILVTGGSGLVGRNLVSYLQKNGFSSVLAPDTAACNLRDKDAVDLFFKTHKPAYVYHMAGHVRGLGGHLNHKVSPIMKMRLSIRILLRPPSIWCQKDISHGTVAMYPHPLPGNPLTEDMMWMGKPHLSEYGYAQAKRGMLAQLEAYKSDGNLSFAMAI